MRDEPVTKRTQHSLRKRCFLLAQQLEEVGQGVGGPWYDDRVSETSRQSAQRFGERVEASLGQMYARIRPAPAGAIRRLRMYELYRGAAPEVPRRPVQNLPASAAALLVPPTADVRAGRASADVGARDGPQMCAQAGRAQMWGARAGAQMCARCQKPATATPARQGPPEGASPRATRARSCPRSRSRGRSPRPGPWPR